MKAGEEKYFIHSTFNFDQNYVIRNRYGKTYIQRLYTNGHANSKVGDPVEVDEIKDVNALTYKDVDRMYHEFKPMVGPRY